MYQITKITEFLITDVFHTDSNKYGIIMGLNTILKQSDEVKIRIDDTLITLDRFECRNSRTISYTTIENLEYKEFIELIIVIDGEKSIYKNTKVNKYPIFENKLLMSIMIKDEDDYIRQWIDYHSNLKIDHFIIYNNSPNYLSLEKILSDHILSGKVIILNWYFDHLYQDQIPTENMRVQIKQIQENHSLLNFQSSKLIGFFDPDEYVNPQIDELDLGNIFDIYLSERSVSLNDIGGFRILSKWFVVLNGEDEDGYEFLKIGTSEPSVVTTGDYKHFVNPKNVKTFSNHDIIIGSQPIVLPEKLLFFNHYAFLNKKDRDPWNKGVANRYRTLNSLRGGVSEDLSILKNMKNMKNLKKYKN